MIHPATDSAFTVTLVFTALWLFITCDLVERKNLSIRLLGEHGAVAVGDGCFDPGPRQYYFTFLYFTSIPPTENFSLPQVKISLVHPLVGVATLLHTPLSPTLS